MEQEKLNRERDGITHTVQIEYLKVQITANCYSDGRLGEIFLRARKAGTVERGLLHCLAVVISLALQHGVPLKKIATKLQYVKFSPAGLTGDPDIPFADSIADYLGKWLMKKFVEDE